VSHSRHNTAQQAPASPAQPAILPLVPDHSSFHDQRKDSPLEGTSTAPRRSTTDLKRPQQQQPGSRTPTLSARQQLNPNMATKKKSSSRLSSLFSLGGDSSASTGHQYQQPPAPNRLSPNVAAQNKLAKTQQPREPPATVVPPITVPAPAPASVPAPTPRSPIVPRKPVHHANTEQLTVEPPVPVRPGHRSQTASPATSRPVSMVENRSRPTTPIPQVIIPSPQLTPEPAAGKVKRKSWLRKDKDSSKHAAKPPAWVLGHPQQLAYDITALANAQRVS
jgi:hypothetical protein